MEVLKIVIWPATVFLLVLIIFLALKEQFKTLVGKMTRFQFKGATAEIGQPENQRASLETPLQSPLLKSEKEDANEELTLADHFLSIFHPSTLDKIDQLVENESHVSKKSDVSDKLDTMMDYSVALYLTLVFERWYSAFFGSQLYILQSLNSVTYKKSELKNYFDIAVQDHPDFYKDFSFDDYFLFLIKTEVLTVDEDGKCSITWLGRDFLKWIVETGRSVAKPY